MRLAWTGGKLTPKEMRTLASMMELLKINQIDLIPQISESKGKWFRLDGDALIKGRVMFVEDIDDVTP